MITALQGETISQWRSKASWSMPCLFYGLVLTIMIFALGPFDPHLQTITPRLFLVAVLLAMFLQAEQLFKQDRDNGYLAQYYLSRLGFGKAITAKLLVQFCLQAVPLLAIATIAAILGGIPSEISMAVVLSISLAMPLLFLLTAFAAALTVSLQQTGLLNAIILVPLYLPVLLFAQSIVLRAQWGEPYIAFVYLLLAALIIAVCVLPYLIIHCLRMSLQ
jgi:heme exporter protein B